MYLESCEIQTLEDAKNTVNAAKPFKIFYDLELKQMQNLGFALPSYSTCYKELRKLGFATQHSTKKERKNASAIRKELEKQKLNLESDLVQKIEKMDKSQQEYSKQKVILEKKYNLKFGEVVEIDACEHNFKLKNYKEKLTIFHAIDVRTGKLLAFWVEKKETNIGYQKLLEILFKKYGKPAEIRADRRRTFWSGSNSKTSFQEFLESHGILLSLSSSPTFKPHVERSFRTVQKLFPSLLPQIGVVDLKTFEDRIDQIIDFYNTKYQKSETGIESVFQKLNDNDWEINLNLNRTLNLGVARFNNQTLIPVDANNQRVYFTLKQNSQFVQASDGNQYFIIDGIKYKSRPIRSEELSEIEGYAIRNKLPIEVTIVKKLMGLYGIQSSFYKFITKIAQKLKSNLEKTGNYNLANFINLFIEEINNLRQESALDFEIIYSHQQL
ncbi:DDE-type integrase/transposase/recombinase [Candidatus Mycoplasma pogonae]